MLEVETSSTGGTGAPHWYMRESNFRILLVSSLSYSALVPYVIGGTVDPRSIALLHAHHYTPGVRWFITLVSFSKDNPTAMGPAVRSLDTSLRNPFSQYCLNQNHYVDSNIRLALGRQVRCDQIQLPVLGLL